MHVRNVAESVLAALRERARRHGRSMQQELLSILEKAAAEPVRQPAPEPIRLVTVETPAASTWRREEIYGDDGR